MLERKIKLLIFAFFIQFIIFNIYSFYPSISQSVSCSPCVVGNCECQVPQGLEFQPTIFGIYESQDCSGNPLFYWKVENGKAVWKPEKTGSYYIRFFVDYKSSQCFSINVGEPDNTPPTTSITTEQKSTNWIKVIFSCSDDKSGCDKTCVCTDTSNTCEPKNCFSWPTQDNFILLPADACTYVRYYSIDKAGNKESMKTTSVGNACGCTRLNPTLNANPTSQRGRPREEKSYSITITNNDNQNCGSSVFKISVNCLENFECKLDKDQIEINPQASGTITLSIKPSSNVKPGKYKFKITATNQNDPQRSSFIEVEYEVIGEEAWTLDFIVKKGNQEIKVDKNMEITIGKEEQVKLIAKTNKDVGEETKKTGVNHFISIERKKDSEWERARDACTQGTSCEYTPERTSTIQTYRARIVILQKDTITPILTSPEATLIFSDWSTSLSTSPQKTELQENEKVKLIATLNKELVKVKDIYVKILEKEEGKEWNVLTIFGSNEEDLGKKEFSYEVQHQKGKYYYKAQVTTTINGREIVLAESNEINLKWITNEVSIYLEPERDSYRLYQPITIHVKGYAVNQIFVEVKNEGYNFWVINPSKTFGPEERIDWVPKTVSSEQEIGRACIFASYQILLTKEWRDTEKKCFSIKGKPKWTIKLEASKTTPFIGEEVTLTAKLCEDEECKQPLPLFHYNIYLIDSNTKEAISPTEDCSGKTSCVFRIKEDSEKTRTFYAIISDSNKQDIRGKSNEVSINWVPKIEKNIAITDIKIIDGAVFYKVKNDGKEKMPPTCSAIYIKYGEKEEQVDVSDYVDSIDVGEERWEAFEEEVNKREINRVVNDVCKNHNSFQINVTVNFGPCAQWGIKEKVKESNERDNSLVKQFACEDFCKEWEKYSNGQCICGDNECDEYYKKWEGVGAKCVNNECKPEDKTDIAAFGVFYLSYSLNPAKSPHNHVCYCIGNKGYKPSGLFYVEIYENDVKVFPTSTPAFGVAKFPHGIECSCTEKEVNKDATYKLVLKPQYTDDADNSNNEWGGKATDLKEFVKKNLKLNIPFVDNYPFIYARVGEGDAVWGKTIYYVRGHKYPFSPFPAAPSVMGPCPLIASSDIYYISIAQFLSEPIIRLTLKCKRPGSGKATLCTSPGGDACWQGFCLPEINYACLSSPPVTQMGYIVSSEKSVPINCMFSSEKESYCYYNLKCEKGLWIILNKEGKPLSAPIIQPLSPTLTIPSSSIKSKGKVKVISVCFKPQIKVYSSVFEVS